MDSIERYGRFSSRAAWLAYSHGPATMPEGNHYRAVLRQFGTCAEICVTPARKGLLMQASKRHYQPAPIKPKPADRVQEGETLEAAIARVEAEIEEARQNNVNRAYRRSAQRVRWIVKTLSADHLLTFTYRENMQDRNRLKRDWQAFQRLVRARYPEWSFVCVVEPQDRGALHIHAAVPGRQDIKYLRRCWYKALGASPDASGADTPGQVNVRAPWKRWGGSGYKWNPDKLAGYLTKYLSKTFIESEKNSKRYWATKGIEVPVQKFWIGAASFAEAIVETHDILRGLGVKHMTMWASEGYEAIWMSGG